MLLSTFEDAIGRFRGTKVDVLSTPEPPPSPAELEAFERAHGFRLPVAYKEATVRLGTGDIGFANVYSVRPGPYNIALQRGEVSGLPLDFVPISDNGCGDFYGFVVCAGECLPEVYFADHESDYKAVRTKFTDLYEYLVRYAFNAA